MGRTKKRIQIIGSGVIGKATGDAFLEQELDVSFVDTQVAIIRRMSEQGYFAATPEKSSDADFYFVCVPTPTINNRADYSILSKAAEELGKRIKRNQVVVLKSTVLPGTTEEIVIPRIEAVSGMKVGSDFGICVSPEFLREKTAHEDAVKPKLIIVGANDEKAANLVVKLYKSFDCPVIKMKIKEAEFQKNIHNIFNANKIAFFNEIRFISDQLGLDTSVIYDSLKFSSEGLWNPEYGLRDLGPFQGACLPKDTEAFYSWATNLGFEVDIIKSVLDQNDKMLSRSTPQRH